MHSALLPPLCPLSFPMGGRSILLLLSFIVFSYGLQCYNNKTECNENEVCLVKFIGKMIYSRRGCGLPLSAECEQRLIKNSKEEPLLVVECGCNTTGCDTSEFFLPLVDKMNAKMKGSVSIPDHCKTVGDLSVLVYTILFGLSLSLVPAIIFFLVRLFCTKRKMDALESKVTTSLRQLQADMAGNSKNVHEVRKKMEQLASADSINSGGSRDGTANGVLSSGGSTGRPSIDATEDAKKEDKKEDKKEEEPFVKSVTLGPPK